MVKITTGNQEDLAKDETFYVIQDPKSSPSTASCASLGIASSFGRCTTPARLNSQSGTASTGPSVKSCNTESYGGRNISPDEQDAIDGLLMLSEGNLVSEESLVFDRNLPPAIATAVSHSSHTSSNISPVSNVGVSPVSSRAPSKRKAPGGARAEDARQISPEPVKKVKTISVAAAESRDWCHALKALTLSDIPDFAPPRAEFEKLSIPSNESSIPWYNATRGRNARTNEHHKDLAVPEQQFIVASGGKLSEAQYIDCKARIFACHRWRTEEDGLTHNIESSQQCCSVDVKTVSVIHRWFDSAKFFNQAWNISDTTQRPEYMQTLMRITDGRNGRKEPPKTMNCPRRFGPSPRIDQNTQDNPHSASQN